MKNEKEYICVKKCPELDYENHKHCRTNDPSEFSKRYEYSGCPVGNTPEWEEVIND